ncbi:hypothetical protein CYY_002299 [Polysphondylium violaceum]|uniref:Aldehyde dehydrogenase domain-containing protein n=1 Tax=Polysphondylium violaceum TaxID=133409 RepID=A0A8J4V9R7_9MYCE|nr:hypothetical protein CYY_002299 [Polysphondylium violaceum]
MTEEKFMLKLNNFINGNFVSPVDDVYMNNYNPSTGEVYSMVPDSSDKDVELAVEAASKALAGWSAKSPAERSVYLYRIADLIEKHIGHLSEAESKDQGKTIKTARTVDIPRSAANFRFYAGQILYTTEPSSAHHVMGQEYLNYTIRAPVGVCGLISPWNLPLYLLTWKIAPAIALGNTCVCKPSEITPMTAFILCDILNEAGLPPGVVNMVFGTGPRAGSALVQHPKVPCISFTGGTKTGEVITKLSSPYHKKLSLELGGKNPAIVFDDCNFEECVEVLVRSSFSNQGEICLCNSRIFVQDTVYERFVEKFVERVKQLKVGDPADETCDMGALISEDHLKKIEYYVDLAKQEGGRIMCGGQRAQVGDADSKFRKGYFYQPTVIVDCKPDSRTMQEEIFGPVVGIYHFSTEQQALSYANDIQYGLSSSVWTKDLDKAHRVAAKVECGICWVNCWMVRDLKTPFGGSKASGVGREGGLHSVEFYTECKNICIKLGK